MLGEVFRCTDTVVAMLFNRREIVSLSKLSKAVQVTNPSNNFKSVLLIRIRSDRHHFAGSGSELASGAYRICTNISISVIVYKSFLKK
jgi:hypothetical protein